MVAHVAFIAYAFPKSISERPPRSLSNLPFEIAIHLERLSIRNSFGITPKGPIGPFGALGPLGPFVGWGGGVGWGVGGSLGVGLGVGNHPGYLDKVEVDKMASPDKLADRMMHGENILGRRHARSVYSDLLVRQKTNLASSQIPR